jgi:hypothetical protein
MAIYGLGVGTHEGDSLSFRQWRRYRRFLAALLADEQRAGRPLHPDTIARLKSEARQAARRTSD